MLLKPVQFPIKKQSTRFKVQISWALAAPASDPHRVRARADKIGAFHCADASQPLRSEALSSHVSVAVAGAVGGAGVNERRRRSAGVGCVAADAARAAACAGRVAGVVVQGVGDGAQAAVPRRPQPLQQEARARRQPPHSAGLPRELAAGGGALPHHAQGPLQADDRRVPRHPAEPLQHGCFRVSTFCFLRVVGEYFY